MSLWTSILKTRLGVRLNSGSATALHHGLSSSTPSSSGSVGHHLGLALTLCVPAPALAAQVVRRHEAIVLGLAHNEATEHLVTCATLARDAIYLYRL